MCVWVSLVAQLGVFFFFRKSDCCLHHASLLVVFLFSASTAFHGLELGFRTALIDDCSRGIQSDGIKNTIEKVKSNHGVVVQSTEVSQSSALFRWPSLVSFQ